MSYVNEALELLIVDTHNTCLKLFCQLKFQQSKQVPFENNLCESVLEGVDKLLHYGGHLQAINILNKSSNMQNFKRFSVILTWFY